MALILNDYVYMFLMYLLSVCWGRGKEKKAF